MNVIVSVWGRVRACGVHICDMTTICISLVLSRYRDTDTIIWCLKCMLRIISRTTWPRTSNQFWLLLNEEEAPILTTIFPQPKNQIAVHALDMVGYIILFVYMTDFNETRDIHSFCCCCYCSPRHRIKISIGIRWQFTWKWHRHWVCGVCVCAGNRAYSCSK